MEGKGARAVIMCVLILGLVVAQIEAKSCCKNTAGRNCYNVCCVQGTPTPVCANLCDCINISGTTCPATHPRSNMLENSEVMISEYCKLGCVSSVCTNENSDVGEREEKETKEHCNNACFEFCNNGAKTSG